MCNYQLQSWEIMQDANQQFFFVTESAFITRTYCFVVLLICMNTRGEFQYLKVNNTNLRVTLITD